MKVRYSKRAVDDLIAVADYIRQYNPSAAEAVEKRIRASIACGRSARGGFIKVSISSLTRRPTQPQKGPLLEHLKVVRRET